MKKFISITQVSVLALALLMIFSSVGLARGFRSEALQEDCFVIEGEVYDLNEQQEADLIFMYEEEKLAHDLYAEFAEQWDARIFANIADSETRHIAAIARLLDKYDLEVETLDRGEFNDQELAELYDELLEQGQQSYEAALEVGREVEIIDIEDLETKAARATPDVELVFNNLKAGSHNHLAAFERQLEGGAVQGGNNRISDRGNRRGR